MAHSVGWFAGAGVAAIVELVVLLRLVAILGQGRITMDVLFWVTWRGGLDVTADRSVNPILYWTGTFGVLALAIAVGGIFAAIWTH